MRPRLAQLHQSGAADGEVPVWDDAAGMWVPGAGSGGGGSGTSGGLDMDGAKVSEQAPADAVIWFPANLADVTVSASPGDRAVVLAPTETYETDSGVDAVQECSVWERGGTFHMLYTGGWATTQLCYATADHPLGPWTKLGPVLGQGVGGESSYGKCSYHFIDDDGEHYTYYTQPYDGVNTFDTLVATGDPADGALTKVGTALTHTVTATAIQNVCVVNDGGTYRMLFDSKASTGAQWQMGYATASDPLGPFTVSTFPLASLQHGTGIYGGPFFRRNEAGTGWVLLYHASTSSTLPDDIYRATSTNLTTWTQEAGPLVGRVLDPPEHDQVADAHYLVCDFGAFLFWSGVNNVGGSEGSSILAMQVPNGDPQWFDGTAWQTDWPTSVTSYTDEQARDAIGAALVEGAGVDITVNDAGDTITIAATGTGSELLMQDGVTAPPVPLENEARDDWLYFG